MASRHPPKSYDETTLQALEQALKEVGQVLKAHDPLRDWDKDADFRRGLADKLMDLADAGVTEPHEFRTKVLASCGLKPLRLPVRKVPASPIIGENQ